MDKKFIDSTQSLINFIKASPTCFQAVEEIEKTLKEAGFLHLEENTRFNIKEGKSYFIKRNSSSLIAFKIPESYKGFSIIASHTDSPTFKLKNNCEFVKDEKYTVVNTEGYGGMLLAPWFDRPLSIAGRVFIKQENEVEEKLVKIDKDLLTIVNLAIHQNRDANKGIEYKKQVDMLPILSLGNKKGAINSLIAETLNVKEDQILSSDLFLYNRTEASIWGLDNEMYSSPRIDDLQGVYTSLNALINTEPSSYINMALFLDNEEVGSGTKQGALSDFLKITIDRIANSLKWDVEDKAIYQANSFMVSSDNGHALHPNYSQVNDVVNKPVLNGGVLIKHSANQKYTTDAASEALFKFILDKEGIPYQEFVNNSDVLGGSTLGNLISRSYSISTIDIGAAQLAMHSPYETGGTMDTFYLIKAMEAFYRR
ncbi:MAG: M18 family aminopeptidase [Sphaerochaetaceae bacterium]|nr:M18 family aminopeptidase [Sphaerochaetaceae bacterium]